ncbi:MAG TPA: DUF3892 domain-containing protein [Burkholderiales bacterium]
MADVQVTCITKPNPEGSHEHITHLGNPAGGWKWTSEKVIANIDSYANAFYVIDPSTGKRSDVGVFRASGKAPCLRARADGDWNNDLLSLGQCLHP